MKLTIFLTLDDTQCKNVFVVIFKKDAPPPSCHAHKLFDLKKKHVIALTNVDKERERERGTKGQRGRYIDTERKRERERESE